MYLGLLCVCTHGAQCTQYCCAYVPMVLSVPGIAVHMNPTHGVQCTQYCCAYEPMVLSVPGIAVRMNPWCSMYPGLLCV